MEADLTTDPLGRGADPIAGQRYTRIRLHGALGRRYGHSHRLVLEAPSARAALRALCVRHDGFAADLAGGTYRVYVGREALTLEEIERNAEATIRVLPVVEGSGGAAGRVLMGAALIALMFVPGVGQVTAGGVVTAGFFGATATTLITSIGAGMLLGGISQLLFAPRATTTADRPSEAANRDPSAVFSGPVNTSAEGNCVPLAYGRVKAGGQLISSGITVEQLAWTGTGWTPPSGIVGSGGGGGKAGGSAGTVRAPQEANDSLRSVQYARVLDLISEGEIHGPAGAGPFGGPWTNETLGPAWAQSVELDGVPVLSAGGGYAFKGLHAFIAVHGTPDQPPIPGFDRTEEGVAVGVQVKSDTPAEVTFEDAEPDAVRVVVGFPALLSQDNAAGDLTGTTVLVAIDIQVDGGGWVPQILGWQAPAATVIGDAINYPAGAVTPAGAYMVQVMLDAIATRDYALTPTASYRVEGWLQYRINGGAWVPHAPLVLNGVNTAIVQSPWMGPGAIEYVFFPTKEWRQREYPIDPSTGDVLRDEYTGERVIVYPEERIVGSDGHNGLIWGRVAPSNANYWAPAPFDTITGKTTSYYTRSYYLPLPAGSERSIRVRKLTPDATTQKTRNDVVFAEYTKINEEKLRYPHSACFGLMVDASQFASIPTRAYHIYGVRVKVPSNYWPWTRAYSGTWDGAFVVNWTDNPAWILYDLLTNTRYGLGQFLPAARLDKWGLYEIAQYCDELVYDGYGGWEPRFTCNVYLQTQADAIEVLRNLASLFRGVLYELGGVIEPVQDRPGNPVAQFTNANVLDGEFTYEGTGLDTRATAVMVLWTDPKRNYELVPEFVEDTAAISAYGYKLKEVTAIGCASRGQAHRFGRALLITEQTQDEIVSFGVGLDAAFVMPGQVIQTLDKRRAGVRHGGRVVAVDASSLTLDAPVDLFQGYNYELTLVKPDGTIDTQTFVPGAYVQTAQLFGVQSLFPWGPVVGTIWVLSRPDVQTELWRVLGISEGEGITARIAAVKYNASKYAAIDYQWGLSERDTSAISLGPPDAPQGLTVQEYIYRKADGKAGVVLWVTWSPNNQWAVGFTGGTPRGYLVEYRTVRDAGGAWGSTQQWIFGPWMSCPEADSPGVATPDVESGTVYDVRLWAIGATGVRSAAPAEVWQYIAGKTTPPANVDSMSATVEGFGIRLAWSSVPDLDVQQYYVQEIANPGANEILLWGRLVGGTSDKIDAATVGLHEYRVYAVDELGNISRAPAVARLDIVAPAVQAVQARFVASSLSASWTVVLGAFAVDHYLAELVDGEGVVQRAEELYATALMWVWSGSGPHLLRITAVDIAGNAGPAAVAALDVVAPGAASARADVVGTTVSLSWALVAGSYALAGAEIRRGALWSTAEPLGVKTGAFTTLSERVPGTYTYLVRLVDVVGNYGPESLVVVRVDPPDGYKLLGDLIFDAAEPSAASNWYGGVMPTDATITWDAWFSANSWANFDDAIAAGHVLYDEPALASGYAEFTRDMGAVIGSCQAVVSLQGEGAGTPAVQLYTRVSSGDAWTAAPAGAVVGLGGFRYVKVRVTVTGGLYRLTGVRAVLSAMTVVDDGIAAASASDASGTVVALTKPFAELTSVIIEPIGTTQMTSAVEFSQAVNPTTFSVRLFDGAGNRVSSNVAWQAKGLAGADAADAPDAQYLTTDGLVPLQDGYTPIGPNNIADQAYVDTLYTLVP
jgi:predicted phage tail protein